MVIVIGLVLVLGLGGFFYLDRAAKKPPPPPPPLTGPARAYAKYLRLMNVEMKAHESYLKQSVVEIEGNIQNVGDRIVKTVEINCIFYDAYGQTQVLRLRSRVSAKLVDGRAHHCCRASQAQTAQQPVSEHSRQKYVRDHLQFLPIEQIRAAGEVTQQDRSQIGRASCRERV